MSITRLQQARQMYALGQRVAKTLDGSRPGYRGEGGYGDGSEEGANSGGANSGGADDRSSAAQTASHNAAVSAAQDYNRAENAKNKTIFGFEKPPSVFGRIGTGIKNYVMGGGLLGMGIRGLGNLFGPPTASTGNVGPAGIKTDGTYGTVGDAIDAGRRNEPPREEGDSQGIMNLYNPNMLNISGEVVDEVPVSQEEDFLQRFRVKNPYRQDKQGQLDPAILDMISKLYT